ncbi:MAG: caspase family protein [Rhizobiaceae bacterium]|nr:caspase family protein [Rhizobiaceae bacterium]
MNRYAIIGVHAFARLFCAVLLVAFTAGSPVRGEPAKELRGVALVIGQSAYEHLAPLANPAGDARAIEDLLARLGFETTVVSDRDARQLLRALDNFVEDAEGADVAVIYYAGHGIEAGGENWLVPVDADISALDAAGGRLVPVSGVIEELGKTVAITVVLLDACRDNPFPSGATLKVSADAPPVPIASTGLAMADTRGAARLVPATPATDSLGTVIGFAAEPGKPALDGPGGEHSPYAAALLKHLSAGGVSFSDLMTMVTEEVYLATGTQQRPWTNASLRRLLYFGGVPEDDDGDDALIRDARRSLLMTIAATPQPTRNFLETLAARDKLPLDQLYGMLEQLDVDISAGPDELDEQLRTGAENLKKFIAEKVAPVRTDPELIRLAGLAERAQAEGAIGLAAQYRAKASARADELAETLDRREADLKADRLQIAATYAEHAETAVLAFDYRTAAAEYAKAYEQVAKWDDKLATEYKFREADALRDFGEIQRGQRSPEKAIATARGRAHRRGFSRSRKSG